QPTGNVTINLSSSLPSEGTVSVSTLTFTTVTGQAVVGGSGGWNVNHTVTVTGQNDLVADGPRSYTIVLDPAISGDSHYGGMDPANVSVVNQDNDVAGITVSPTSGLVTNEGGLSTTFTVILTSQPTSNVTIGLTSSNTGEATV